ncbi:hypothetical protein DPEC_G00300540, partial [Dallia pectoralis]
PSVAPPTSCSVALGHILPPPPRCTTPHTSQPTSLSLGAPRLAVGHRRSFLTHSGRDMALRKKDASLFVGLVMLSLAWKAAWATVNMVDRVDVNLGDTAQITCKFPGTGDNATVQWFTLTPSKVRSRLHPGDVQHKISVNGSVSSGEQVLTITNVEVKDELVYICQVQRASAGSEEGRTAVKVFAQPDRSIIEKADAAISVVNRLPSKVGICETENGYPQPNITWYRGRSPLLSKPGEVDVRSVVTTLPNGLYKVRSELHLKVTKEDKDSLFYCEVSYHAPGGTMMTETDKINIIVNYPTTSVTVWVESPKGPVKEGDTVEIRCRGNGNPQPPLTIKLNQLKVEQDVWVIENVTRLLSGKITCAALDLDTYEDIVGEAELFVNILDTAVLSHKDSHVMAKGSELTVTCNAFSSLQTHTEWFKKGKKVAVGHMLVLKEAGFETAGIYVCEVTVPLQPGLKTTGSIHVYVSGPPEIKESNDVINMKDREEVLSLSCHAAGYPTPVIKWSFSEHTQNLNAEPDKQTDDGVSSVVRIKVTSDLTAHCKASNDLGADSRKFSIIAVPQTTETARSTTVTDLVSTVTTPPSVTAPPSLTTPPSVAPPKKVKKEGSGVIIAVIIICILLLAILGSVLYFLYKKGKIPCGRSGKQDLTKVGKDNIVVEMKSDSTEEAVLLGVNGDNKLPNNQGDMYMDVEK